VWGRELSEEAERIKRREERRKKDEEDRLVRRDKTTPLPVAHCLTLLLVVAGCQCWAIQ
jgi:hypothetical protein